jgi:hypothetical protein
MDKVILKLAMQEIGRVGGEKTLKKYGTTYFKEISKLAAIARKIKAKKNAY